VGTLHDISFSSSSKWEMFQTKVIEEIKSYVQYFFLRKSCHLWDNVEKHSSTREAEEANIIWRMRIAWWTPKGTNTHSEYVIHVAFTQQKYWHERASLLVYKYIACIINVTYSGLYTVIGKKIHNVKFMCTLPRMLYYYNSCTTIKPQIHLVQLGRNRPKNLS